jgi:hypothetical protein
MNTDIGITRIKNILQHQAAQHLLHDVAATDDTVDKWLARLILLGDVPFHDLIADTRLLPQNAIRFFYVDPSWLYALIDGALSIGTNTSAEALFTAVMAESVRDRSSVVADKMRARLLGMDGMLTTEMEPLQDNLVAGLLMRSEVVRSFPGLKIIPTYSSNRIINPVPLRYETLSDDLLLVIFPAVPQSVKIQQPPQGLQFGFIDKATATGPFQARLRNISGPTTGTQVVKDGEKVLANIPSDTLFRPDASNGDKKYVVDISTLKSTIQASLQASGAYPQPVEPISASQFVMQIINTPEEAIFVNTPTKEEHEQ